MTWFSLMGGIKLILGVSAAMSWPIVAQYHDQPRLAGLMAPVTPAPSRVPTLTPTPIPTPAPIKNTPAPAKPTQPAAADLTAAVNRWRQDQGLAPVSQTPELCAAARKRAAEVGGNLDHSGYTRALAGISHTSSAENLWWGTKVEVEAVIASWAQSPGHRQNLAGDYTQGCGEISGQTAVLLLIKL